ncbi:hypothetical protein GGI15_003679 [Coemansia interrupta]|uniref:RBR-type E3 ubiquitin transferase n=1 Tax=Coemansia interrupta TaxID=1126814 RepID=A0A9W8H6C5_9FUNG|nr:hypothetical protein GGI15_003679 [Coemansia interrupta]
MNEDECTELQQCEMQALEAIYGGGGSSSDSDGNDPGFEYSAAQPVRGSVKVNVESSVVHQLTQDIDTDIHHLPPIKMTFTLPPAYPLVDAPDITISCCWLDSQAIDAVRQQLSEIWQQQQGMGVLHSYIDALKYDLASAVHSISIGNDQDRETIMSYDQRQKRRQFELQSYTCAICIEDQSGKHCIRLSCGHVFCRSCLSSYLGILIDDGSVNQLRCPDVQCRKSPSAQITDAEMDELLTTEQVLRYRRLYEQRKVDGDWTRYAWCPRAGCGRGVECDPQVDRLCQCACGYAFCRLCLRAWHGSNFCEIKNAQSLVERYIHALGDTANPKMRLKMEKQYGQAVLEKMLREHEQDSASLEFISGSTQQCPRCRFGIQKTQGCNQMHCPQCDARFCYVCGAFTSKDNPAGRSGTSRAVCSCFVAS